MSFLPICLFWLISLTSAANVDLIKFSARPSKQLCADHGCFPCQNEGDRTAAKSSCRRFYECQNGCGCIKECKHEKGNAYFNPVSKRCDLINFIQPGTDLYSYFGLCIAMDVVDKKPLRSNRTRSLLELVEEAAQVLRLKDLIDLCNQLIEQQDEDMLRVYQWYHGPEFKAINDHMWNSDDFRKFFIWLRENGLPMDQYYTWLYGEMGWGSFIPPVSKNLPKKPVEKSLKSLYQLMTNSLHFMEFFVWVLEELDNPDMSMVFDKLMSQEFRSIHDWLYQSPTFLQLRCRLIAEELNVIQLEEAECSLLAWHPDCKHPQCIGKRRKLGPM